MSNYSTILEALAKKPLRPILEDFQTNRSTAGGLSIGGFYLIFEGNATHRSALADLFSSLEKEDVKFLHRKDLIPTVLIPMIVHQSLFVPFLKNQPSAKNSLNSFRRSVPEDCSDISLTPTEQFENELDDQSYTCILNFWDGVFEGKDLSDQTKRIWESYKNYKIDPNPKNIPFNLAEQGVTEPLWLPSEYFPTLARYENDVPLRGKIYVLTDVKRRKAKLIEMAAYVSEIFRRQPLRRFVHGFCLFDKEIEFWLIDQTGAFSSGLVSIEDDEQVLVRAISSYLLMSDEELGLDTTIRKVDGRSMITISSGESGETREIEIDPKPLIRPRELFSNGTACYRSLDDKLLVKYSWRKICGKSEIDFLKEALPVKGVINLVASDTIHRFLIIGKIYLLFVRIDGTWLKKKKSDEEDEEDESYETSEFRDFELNRLVLSPYGHPPKSCRSVLQFLIVMRDAITGHQRLYNEKKITHGDISQGNIIIVTPTEEDRSRGMLIDFDNSYSMHDEFLWEKEYFFAGTIKYMAYEVLLCAAGHRLRSLVAYLFYHNYVLESFFYVFLAGCVEYGRDSDQPRHNLELWDTGDMDKTLKHKKDDMNRNFKDLVHIKFSSSFIDVKELAFELHKIVFGNPGYHFEHVITERFMHNKMILALNRTIGRIEAGKIPNRMWTD
ncbi:unnamed protein product [Blumeria hordei]|uniref:Fungal-type protein kinase domain-containing protein n=1 Tax=Blumeria hordei TaxID=2867405 RepID=A0A383UPG0_BLUHO|nr:unnamed protein product [Blumeria hordei]